MSDNISQEDIKSWRTIKRKWKHRLGICNRRKAGYSCSGKGCS